VALVQCRRGEETAKLVSGLGEEGPRWGGSHPCGASVSGGVA
jgi:hypothetical protein